MKELALTMGAALVFSNLLLFSRAAGALDKVNVTLPSKSFQFIIFPLAKERGYRRRKAST